MRDGNKEAGIPARSFDDLTGDSSIAELEVSTRFGEWGIDDGVLDDYVGHGSGNLEDSEGHPQSRNAKRPDYSLLPGQHVTNKQPIHGRQVKLSQFDYGRPSELLVLQTLRISLDFNRYELDHKRRTRVLPDKQRLVDARYRDT
jgi:hypothetical protein